MEADSTTLDLKTLPSQMGIPFTTRLRNLKLYKKFIHDDRGNKLPTQLTIKHLQEFGLIPKLAKCTKQTIKCKVEFKKARVVDRVQWVCKCGARERIRVGSFFQRLPCSVTQTMQIVLGWCEDADFEMVAENFDVKPKLVSTIYDKMDELSAKELDKQQLGGENSVVLVDMYPDCLNRLSPDTTDQPHGHRILMLADSNHIPTRYRLYVVKESTNKKMVKQDYNNQALKIQLSEVISKAVAPNSTVVIGGDLPVIDGTLPLMQLLQQCDIDMQHFLTSRIWSQAVTLCLASRDLCGGHMATPACVASVQRYLNSSLYRIRFEDGYYEHTLRLIAKEYTNDIVVIGNKENNIEKVNKQINETQSDHGMIEVKKEVNDEIHSQIDIKQEKDVEIKTEINDYVSNILPDTNHNMLLTNNDHKKANNQHSVTYPNNVIAIDEGNIIVPKVELMENFEKEFVVLKNVERDQVCNMLSFGNDRNSVWNAQLSVGNEMLNQMDQKSFVGMQTIEYDNY